MRRFNFDATFHQSVHMAQQYDQHGRNENLPLVADIWARYEGRSQLAGSDVSRPHHIGPPDTNNH